MTQKQEFTWIDTDKGQHTQSLKNINTSIPKSVRR